MKKITRIWQLMLVAMLISSVGFAQSYSVGTADKAEKKKSVSTFNKSDALDADVYVPEKTETLKTTGFSAEQMETLYAKGLISEKEFNSGVVSSETMAKLGAMKSKKMEPVVVYSGQGKSGDCNHRIELVDSYGDGWNGGSVDVLVNSTVVLDDITLSSGAGPGVFYFSATTGDDIDVLYTAGSWSTENEFQVFDGDGNLLGESGQGGTTPSDVLDMVGYCPSCVAPMSPTTTNVTTTEATLSWSSSESTFNYEYGATGFAPGTGAELGSGTTHNLSVDISGLSSGTEYDWYVRTDCGGGDYSSWLGPNTFATPPACGDTWYDTGGASGDYSVNENYTTTIYPSTSGDVVTVTFNMFNTEQGWDGMMIYDGPDDTYPVIGSGSTYNRPACPNDAWTGAPGDTYSADGQSFTSTDASGALTFVFTSDGSVVRPGWEASITCGPPPACPDPSALSVSNVTVSEADLEWTSYSGSSNIEYGLQGFTLGTDPIGTASAVTSPYSISGLSPSTAYDFYVQDDCGGGDLSAWVGPFTFTTEAPIGEILGKTELDPITGNGFNLGIEYFNGYLWVTGRDDANGHQIYQIDPTTNTLVNSYPQGTSSTWGMRDLANDGTYLYAGDDDGFYQIDPATGAVTTLFSPTGMGTIRALAYDGTHFWTKSFTGDVYEFDAAGTIINQYTTGASGVSAYGAAYDPSVPCIWWHASVSGDNYMVQMDMSGNFTGYKIKVPLLDCGGNGGVGGAFMDNGNLMPGRYVFGVLDQASPDVLKVFEAYDTGYPDQTSNYSPACGSVAPANGSLTWDFGANTTTYDLYFGEAGAMVQVVSGASVTGPSGSYAYSGLTGNTEYEWKVVGNNSTGSTESLVHSFTTPCDIIAPPYSEDFAGADFPSCWSQTSDLTSEKWAVSATTNAGGNANEMKNSWQSGTGITRLISPVFDLSGTTNPQVTFKHFFDDYGAGITAKIQTSTDGGATWVDESWSIASGSGNVGPETVAVPLTNTGANTLIAWVLDGDHYQFDYWYVDDVHVFDPLAHDVATASIDIPSVVYDVPVAPVATVVNNGLNAETFDVTMTISDGYTSTKTVGPLAPNATQQVTFDDWNPTHGTYTVDVCTSLGTDMDNSNDCISGQSVEYYEFVQPVYAYNAYSNGSSLPKGPIKFELSDPSKVVSLADQSSENFIPGATWADGVWYGSVYTDNDFISIDPVTGARTVIGNFGVSILSLSYDVTSSTMYGIGGSSADTLYTIDMTTGAASLVGYTGAGGTLIGLSINANGDAYAINISTDELGSIDLTTGTYTSIGAIGFDANYAQDMSFDLATGVCYLAAFNNSAFSGELRTVDLTTGATTLVAAFDGGMEVTGFAIPYSPGHTVSGVLEYATTTPQPMDNCTIELFDSAMNSMGTSVTDTLGNFSFSGIPDGTYTWSFTTSKARGGTDLADLNLILDHIGGTAILSGLYFVAADVSDDDVVDLSDMNGILDEIGGGTTWAAPDFVTDGGTITVSGGDVTITLQTLSSGDPAPSYTIPLGK